MKIKKLHLKNFRCFEDFEIEFNTKQRIILRDGLQKTAGPLTVIVAKNGMGKSTVLDAVRIAFGTFTSAFDYPSIKHIEKTDIHIKTPEGTIQSELITPVIISASGEIDSQPCEWKRILPKENGRTSIKEAKRLTEWGNDLKKVIKQADGNNALLPLIAYYGTGRLWNDHKNTQKDKPLLRPRDYGYDYALGSDSNFKATSQWLMQAIQEEINEQVYQLKNDEVMIAQLNAIRIALDALLNEEGYISKLHINQKFRNLAVLAKNSDNETISIPVSQLSDGVRAIFSMIADIAFRCAKLNPALGEEACEKTEGIVLIDEIDLHLHPSWQQKILETLQWTFPKIQFIVTTHSPQVVSSVPKECVRIISAGQVSSFSIQTQGVEVGDILAGIFGTHPTPFYLEIVEKLNRLSAMVSEGLYDTEEWQQLYKELEGYYGKEYGPLAGTVAHANFLRKRKGE